jgi:hypothetical protein
MKKAAKSEDYQLGLYVFAVIVMIIAGLFSCTPHRFRNHNNMKPQDSIYTYYTPDIDSVEHIKNDNFAKEAFINSRVFFNLGYGLLKFEVKKIKRKIKKSPTQKRRRR